MTARGRVAAAVLAVLAGSAPARAEPPNFSTPNAGVPLTPTGFDVRPYWSQGQARWFLSSSTDFGFTYLRPQLALGYGRPHWSWVGVETFPLLSPNNGGAYLGVRGTTPISLGPKAPGFPLDLRAGSRLVAAFDRSFLQPRDRYDRYQVEALEAPDSLYYTLEAELTGSFPLGTSGGALVGVLSGFFIRNVPQGLYLFEEGLRIVIEPPWLWRARLGYFHVIGDEHPVRVGPAVEVLSSPERGNYVYRGGVLTSVSLWPNLEVLASFVPVLWSRDALGLGGGDFANLGIRYRWATGMPPVP